MKADRHVEGLAAQVPATNMVEHSCRARSICGVARDEIVFTSKRGPTQIVCLVVQVVAAPLLYVLYLYVTCIIVCRGAVTSMIEASSCLYSGRAFL